MKNFFIFLTILLLAFIQAAFLKFNLLLVTVLVLSFSVSPQKALLGAFLSGLFLDLFAGTRLGFTSLALLAPSFLIILYRHRFSFKSPVSVAGSAVISYFLFSWIAGNQLQLIEGLLLVIFIIAFRLLLPFLFEDQNEDQQKIHL